MKFKHSSFNVVVNELENGSKLMYNTYSGIFGIMDKQTQGIFNDIENLNTEEAKADGSMGEDVLNNINIMHQAGYIVHKTKTNRLPLSWKEQSEGMAEKV